MNVRDDPTEHTDLAKDPGLEILDLAKIIDLFTVSSNFRAFGIRWLWEDLSTAWHRMGFS